MSKYIYESNYLMHHGIKGQKWGVENGPPYPLNPQRDYSKAEQKALSKSIKNMYKKDPSNNRMQFLNLQNIKSISDEIDSDQINQLKDDIVKKIKIVNKANKPLQKVDYDSSKLTKEQISAYQKAKDDVDIAWDNFNKYSSKVVSNLVGKYGDVKLSKAKTIFDKKHPQTIRNEVEKAIYFAVQNNIMSTNDKDWVYYSNEVEKW